MVIPGFSRLNVGNLHALGTPLPGHPYVNVENKILKVVSRCTMDLSDHGKIMLLDASNGAIKEYTVPYWEYLYFQVKDMLKGMVNAWPMTTSDLLAPPIVAMNSWPMFTTNYTTFTYTANSATTTWGRGRNNGG